MAAALRAFVAGNVQQYTTAVTAVSAPKPNGLAVGDIWLVQHSRRSTTADTALPAGFTLLGTRQTGSNQNVAIYYKIADAADVAGGAKAWTQSVSAITLIQSFALAGADTTTPFDAESPTTIFDVALTQTRDIPAQTPNVDGLMFVIATNAVQLVGWDPPTTQGGGWTEYSDTQMDGGASASRETIAAYTKSRTAASGATGVVTITNSTQTTQAVCRLILVNDAAAGTTRVTDDVDLRWQVAARVTDDVDLRWAVKTRVTDDVDLRWAVKTRVTDDVDLRWAVLVSGAAPQTSLLLPNIVLSQSGYGNATTGNVGKLHGDPDVAGGVGFLVCPFGKTVGQMRDTPIFDIHECPVGGMR